jgi:hypothetical protein
MIPGAKGDGLTDDTEAIINYIMSTIPTALQKRRFAKIAELGCIICGGIAEIHHCGTAMGSRKNHDLVIPLCHSHHTSGGYGVAIHAGKKAWEYKYGTEQEFLEKVSKIVDNVFTL